jgi:NitT/TauT family transport system ATP-binding protein
MADVPRISDRPPQEFSAADAVLMTAATPGDHDHQPNDGCRTVRIQLKEVRVAVSSRVILEHVTAQVYDGEVVTIIGSSGVGKTTLINVIAGLLPFEGDALIEGRRISGPGPDRAMVFQEDAVFPWLTVRRNTEYGLRMRGLHDPELSARVDRVLTLVGLAGRSDAYPRQLSGGMRKRVDFARALAIEPDVLLMDEPYGDLDHMTKARLQVEFLNAVQSMHMTSMFVTHDLEEAIFVGDRIMVLGGTPGRVADVFEVPFAHPREQHMKLQPEFQALRGRLSEAIGANEV